MWQPVWARSRASGSHAMTVCGMINIPARLHLYKTREALYVLHRLPLGDRPETMKPRSGFCAPVTKPVEPLVGRQRRAYSPVPLLQYRISQVALSARTAAEGL